MTHESYEIQELQEKDAERDTQEEPKRERRLRLGRQVLMVMVVTMAYAALGASLTWPSPAVSSLEKDNSTLVGTEIVLNDTEKDMTGSLVYLGSLFGAWIGGWVVSKIGRRLSLLLVGPPFIIGWIISALAPNSVMLLVGRLIHGLSSGCLTIAGYAFIMELSDTSIRGRMATLPTLGIVLGNLYTVAVGYVIPWHYLCFVGAIPAVIFTISVTFLPESPSYLVINNKRQKAISILKTLRGKYVNVEAEVTKLENMNSVSSGGWRGLLERDILRRIIVVVTTFFLSQMCGNFVIMIYTTRILQSTVAPMNPDAITAIAGVLRVAGTISAIFLLDILGRRYCLVVSHAVNAGCMLILGTYVHFAEAAEPNDNTFTSFTWVPMVCVMTSLFFCDIGVHPIPFIISSEYFPTNIRAQASSVCFSWGTVIIFSVMQLYSPMLLLFTQPGLYWFYGSISILGTFFALFIIIETKGKAVG